jgi:hypothetical protein
MASRESGLITFHRFLIGAAIVFCLLFAGWMGAQYRDLGGAGRLALAAGFAVAAVVLGYYLANLRRFLGR